MTEPSSPAGDSRDDLGQPKPVYRDALGLPRELRLRCHIHLEEQYCEHGQCSLVPVVMMRAKQDVKTLPP